MGFKDFAGTISNISRHHIWCIYAAAAGSKCILHLFFLDWGYFDLEFCPFLMSEKYFQIAALNIEKRNFASRLFFSLSDAIFDMFSCFA